MIQISQISFVRHSQLITYTQPHNIISYLHPPTHIETFMQQIQIFRKKILFKRSVIVKERGENKGRNI